MTKYTSEIFEILRRGQFISSNSPNERIQTLYRFLEDDYNYDKLYDYFIEISYKLEKGDDYFYFSRLEKKADLERKIEKAFEWIDFIDFFKTFNSSFSSGFRFTPSEIANQLSINADLKSKLNSIKRISTDKKNNLDRINKIIESLERDGFIALENEITDTYKVLASFKYLEEIVDIINIPEDIANEIPE
jgi:hypothetical protein